MRDGSCPIEGVDQPVTDRGGSTAIDGHVRVRNTDVVPEAAVVGRRTSPDRLLVDVDVVVPNYSRPAPMVVGDEDGVINEVFTPSMPDEPAIRDASEGSFGRCVLLEVVFGNDDRVPVMPPQIDENPWRQICALRITAATGGQFVGTGWFIGPNVVATAGHCVYLQHEGGWATEIAVVPGKDGDEEPFGRARSQSFASVHGWVSEHSRDFDYGVIFLDEPLGEQVGNFAVEAQLDAELTGAIARVSGYPADRDLAVRQYFHERLLDDVNETRLFYRIDTFGGQSGSPIWRQTEGRPAVAIGIHTAGGATANSGTRISEPVLDNLIAWNAGE
jgi:glutamyl endopeptidase